jgi:hypothetical protein
VTFAKDRGMLHVAVIASHGEQVYDCFHIQIVNAYTNRSKSWIAPFKGVTLKYLGSFLGWPRMIERVGDRLPRRRALPRALGA